VTERSTTVNRSQGRVRWSREFEREFEREVEKEREKKKKKKKKRGGNTHFKGTESVLDPTAG
jgi:hypothetical protein